MSKREGISAFLENIKSWKLATLILVGVYAALAAVYYIQFGCETKCEDMNQADWGQLGDYMGGLLNPLLTLAVFIVAYKTYLEQKKSLKNQEETNNLQRFFDSTNRAFARIEQKIHNEEINIPTNAHKLKTAQTLKTRHDALDNLLDDLGFEKACHDKDPVEYPLDISTWKASIENLASLSREIFTLLHAIQKIASALDIDKKVTSSQLLSIFSNTAIASLIFILNYKIQNLKDIKYERESLDNELSKLRIKMHEEVTVLLTNTFEESNSKITLGKLIIMIESHLNLFSDKNITE
jgi:uncharacterized membrane protein